jgi:hypothetical protein
MNRQELQDAYINQVIDNMDQQRHVGTGYYDFMNYDLDKYSDLELNQQVSQFYPESY